MIWRCKDRAIDLSTVKIMGILNITPDSFYTASRLGTDFSASGRGGSVCGNGSADVFSAASRFGNGSADAFSADSRVTASAVARARRMIDDGADILDIGGQSTRPGCVPVSAGEEWARIADVLPAVAALGVPVSVDTFYAEVAEKAVAAGAVILNDISGSLDNGMLAVAAETGAGLVLMHSVALPPMRDYFAVAIDACLAAGCAREQLCLDPGVGFQKDRAEDARVVADLADLTAGFGLPVLVGASRKRVAGENLPPEQRLPGTLALHALAQWNGANILRVHDVAEAVAAARAVAKVKEAR